MTKSPYRENRRGLDPDTLAAIDAYIEKLDPPPLGLSTQKLLYQIYQNYERASTQKGES